MSGPLLRVLAPALALATLSTLWSPSARADLIRFGYDETTIDPSETFDADCLGGAPADDCDARAALIEAELVTLLARLEHDTDPQTLPLFEAALELESPVVQAMAVRYLSRAEQQPTGFLDKVKTFFLGPDAPLGVQSAEVLALSTDDADQQLAQLYREQRSRSDYEPSATSGESPETEDPLVLACSLDARLEQMPSFTEEEQFAPAQRLLMYDRFVLATFDPTRDYPVTTFLTDASVEEVTVFFSSLFGDARGPVAESEQRLQELTVELQELQGAAGTGDQKAIAELQRVVDELLVAQEVVTIATFLQLPSIHAENDVFWLDGSADDVASSPARAVTVGHDERLGGTVIRYLNAPSSQGGQEPGSGDGNGNAGASGGEEPAGAGGASDAPTSGSSDGCGCSVPGRSSPLAAFAALPLLGVLLRRLRRRRMST